MCRVVASGGGSSSSSSKPSTMIVFEWLPIPDHLRYRFCTFDVTFTLVSTLANLAESLKSLVR